MILFVDFEDNALAEPLMTDLFTNLEHVIVVRVYPSPGDFGTQPRKARCVGFILERLDFLRTKPEPSRRQHVGQLTHFERLARGR